MVGNMALWDESVLRAVTSAARRIEKQHAEYVEFEDLQQEGYLYIAAHQDKVAVLVEGKNLGYLQRDLFRAMHKYAMKQRYLKDGTKPGDYFLYPLAVLAELLPEVLDGPDAADTSPSDLNGQIRANKPLSERGDKAAMLADVQKAFASLDDDDRVLLREKYGDGGVTDEVLAMVTGLKQQTVNYRIHRALRRMAEFLGGEPWERRRAVSNARAQHETRNLEDA